ncbi:PAS domain-containing hybrid sensor histidine kinase/response regulator [Flavobacterium suzhouense]|uniref:histidine kinase n=1 Tax=Flavobacterium suzhouense TaxID=1529638 RepID=A0ABW5NXB2_9FLAO
MKLINMNNHKLLQRQINKYIPTDLIDNPSFQSFIKAVNDSYISFERDKDLMDHSFKESEKEYHEVNQNLKKEYELKQESISNLYKSLTELKSDKNFEDEIKQNDLLFISRYISDEILKRKETEKKLFETAEFLRVLLDNIQSGILFIDNTDTILYVNQHLCDIRNIHASPVDMMGKKPDYYLNDVTALFKDPDAYKNRIVEIIKNKDIVTGEILETIDGRFLERDYIPIIVEETFIGHLWKSTDVTQKIISKNLLQQSEERNRIIMNSSLNAIITIDINGKITFWNNQAEVIFGWKRDEVLGKTLNDTIIPNRHKQEHFDGLKHYVETGEGPVLNKQIELPAVNKNNIEFPIEISIIPLEQDGEVFFCSFIQDISERKKGEAKLRLQEEKYRNIIANINLGLIEVNTEEVIQFANQSFAEMSGFEVDELIGLSALDTFVFGENIEVMKDKNRLRKNGISDVYQIPVRNKRGELRWWAVGGAPNYDDKGNLVGSIGIHLDITEQKQMELELESEKIKAQEASKAKEAFLANMSHEIRTPLNAIIGFLRELERQGLSETQKKYVDNSAIASKHLLSIINNILDISKIEAGEMSLEDEDFIFSDAINNVITVMQPIATEKGLKLYSDIAENTGNVFKGDILRLEQILFNLIGNSLKFTTEGFISLNCKVLKDNNNFQEVCISVTDTGIGMEQSFANTIFNKFSQEDKSTTRKFGGTGLGMAITRELVQLMKGHITIESQKNVGTTINIILQLEKGVLKNVKKPQSEINHDIAGTNILLVEDNQMNRMVVNYTLNYFNCKVTEATNGLEALDILKKDKFDVILMDVQMPEMGGIEATKIIREVLKIDTPIIALTANAFKSEIDKCKEAGMNDYVTKPFEESVLIETLARYTINKDVLPENIIERIDIAKLYDLKILNNMSKGNNEFVQKMISIFISQTEDVIDRVDKALVDEDFPLVSQLIHKIKPSIESMGILSIMEDVKRLEKIAKESSDRNQITILFIHIKNILLIVIEKLKEEIKV